MGTIEQEIEQLSRTIQARAGGGPAKAVADTGSVMLSLKKLANTSTESERKLQQQASITAINANIRNRNAKANKIEQREYDEAKREEIRDYNESQYEYKRAQRRADEATDLEERREYGENLYDIRKEDSHAYAEKIHEQRLKEEKEKTRERRGYEEEKYIERLEESRGYAEGRTLEGRIHAKEVLGEGRTYAKTLVQEAAVIDAEKKVLESFGTRADELNTVSDVNLTLLELDEFDARYNEVVDKTTGEVLVPANDAMMALSTIERQKLLDKAGFLEKKEASIWGLNKSIREFEDLRQSEFSSGDLIFTDHHSTDLMGVFHDIQDAYTKAEELKYVTSAGQHDERIARIGEYITLRASLERLDAEAQTREFDMPDLSAIELPEAEWLTIGGKKVKSSAQDALRESLRLLETGDLKEATRLFHVSDAARRRSIDKRADDISAAARAHRGLIRAGVKKEVTNFNNTINNMIADVKGSEQNMEAMRKTDPWMPLKGEMFPAGFTFGIPNEVNLSNASFEEIRNQAAKALLATLAISAQPGKHEFWPALNLMGAGARDVDNVIRLWAERGFSAVEAGDIVTAIKNRKGGDKGSKDKHGKSKEFMYFGKSWDFRQAKQWPEAFTELDLLGGDMPTAVQRSHLNSVWGLYELLENRGPIMEAISNMETDGGDVTLEFLKQVLASQVAPTLPK
jgi:hypothetical protein